MTVIFLRKRKCARIAGKDLKVVATTKQGEEKLALPDIEITAYFSNLKVVLAQEKVNETGEARIIHKREYHQVIWVLFILYLLFETLTNIPKVMQRY